MQAERDSLAGLSEVLTSQTPSLVPDVGGWYGGANQASEQQPQQPGLTHLRHRLGLPLQQQPCQALALQEARRGAAQHGVEESTVGGNQAEVNRFSHCTYEVSQI